MLFRGFSAQAENPPCRQKSSPAELPNRQFPSLCHLASVNSKLFVQLTSFRGPRLQVGRPLFYAVLRPDTECWVTQFFKPVLCSTKRQHDHAEADDSLLESARAFELRLGASATWPWAEDRRSTSGGAMSNARCENAQLVRRRARSAGQRDSRVHEDVAFLTEQRAPKETPAIYTDSSRVFTTQRTTRSGPDWRQQGRLHVGSCSTEEHAADIFTKFATEGCDPSTQGLAMHSRYDWPMTSVRFQLHCLSRQRTNSDRRADKAKCFSVLLVNRTPRSSGNTYAQPIVPFGKKLFVPDAWDHM